VLPAGLTVLGAFSTTGMTVVPPAANR